MPDDCILHEGLLFMHSGKGSKKKKHLKKSFKLHIHDSKPILEYYKDANAQLSRSEPPIEIFHLSECMNLSRKSDQDNEISLAFPTKTLTVWAEKIEETNHWENILRDYVKVEKSLVPPPEMDTTYDLPKEELQPPPPRAAMPLPLPPGAPLPPVPESETPEPTPRPTIRPRKASEKPAYMANSAPPEFNEKAEPMCRIKFFSPDRPRRSSVPNTGYEGSDPTDNGGPSVNLSRNRSCGPLVISPGRGACSASVPPVIAAMEGLKQEILSPGGVKVSIQPQHLLNSVALVEMGGAVWVAGWNCQTTLVHHLFHIGDQIMKIDDEPVQSVRGLESRLEPLKDTWNECCLRIRRMPLARAFVLCKTADTTQNLGLKMDHNGTNKIAEVTPQGLAEKSGLPRHNPGLNWGPLWSVTEVNNRTLDLYFKNKEAEYFLGALGQHISVVVQPTNFIEEMKKQLKKKKGDHTKFIVGRYK